MLTSLLSDTAVWTFVTTSLGAIGGAIIAYTPSRYLQLLQFEEQERQRNADEKKRNLEKAHWLLHDVLSQCFRLELAHRTKNYEELWSADPYNMSNDIYLAYTIIEIHSDPKLGIANRLSEIIEWSNAIMAQTMMDNKSEIEEQGGLSEKLAEKSNASALKIVQKWNVDLVKIRLSLQAELWPTQTAAIS